MCTRRLRFRHGTGSPYLASKAHLPIINSYVRVFWSGRDGMLDILGCDPSVAKAQLRVEVPSVTPKNFIG